MTLKIVMNRTWFPGYFQLTAYGRFLPFTNGSYGSLAALAKGRSGLIVDDVDGPPTPGQAKCNLPVSRLEVSCSIAHTPYGQPPAADPGIAPDRQYESLVRSSGSSRAW